MMDMQGENQNQNRAEEGAAVKSAGYDPRAPKQSEGKEVIMYECHHCDAKTPGKLWWSNEENDTLVLCGECGKTIQVFIAYRTSLPMKKRSFY